MNQNFKKITQEANFLSLTGNLSVSFFGFAGFALLARIYPMNVFGEWVLLLSTAALLDMFRYGVTNTAMIRYLSGADKDQRPALIGSFVLIVLMITIILAVLIWGVYLIFRVPVDHAGYGLVFKWYPLIAFAGIPMNTAVIVLQADLRFDRMLLVNTIYSASFFFTILLDYLLLEMNLNQLVLIQLILSILVSLLCVILGWDGTRYLFRATRKTNKQLIDFGKFTTLTLIGTNLLRSADTFIISLSPLGTAAVALYSIPMKLTELQQIPLRSFVATAFPKMSKESIQGKIEEVKKLFYTYSGAMTYLFVGISLVTFVFAEPFVLLFGGERYLLPDPVTGAYATDIVRIFSFYGLLLPYERMTGIGLDSVNKPSKNFQKVMYMVIANIIGDLIAVFILKSLEAVAVGSILFTMFGVWLGYYFLDKQIGLEHRKVFSYGNDFYKCMYRKVRNAITV